MLAELIGEIVEVVLRTMFSTILGVLGLEEVAEVVGAIFGLGCIVAGFTAWWFGH
jgi:hypothetical protein